MRHGQSIANVEQIVVSAPDRRALVECGLTALGRRQAREAAARSGLTSRTVIVTSDFARARETADIVADVIGAAAPTADVRLRERNFGEHEGGPADVYAGVWEDDDAGREPAAGVESPRSVAARVQSLLSELEAADTREGLLLVAHGDVLQIAEAVIRGLPPHAHRRLPHMENAEIRRMPSER